MMHHSRDTAAKQWSETWAVALGAVARLYRTFLHQLMRRHRFADAWDALLAILQTSILALPRSLEVATSAIGAAHALRAWCAVCMMPLAWWSRGRALMPSDARRLTTLTSPG